MKNYLSARGQMKAWGILAFILLAVSAFATTTVTGNIQSLGTGALTTGSFVRFYLRGCAGNQPRVNGTAVIGPAQGGVFFFDLAANGSGAVSGTIYSTRDSAGTGNGDIECGGSRTAVWYGMVIFSAGKSGPEVAVHAKSGTSLDISTVTPLVTSPVVTPPTGDATYARLDGGNTPFTGPVSFNAGITKPTGGTLNIGSGTNYFHILDDPGGSGIFQTAVDPKNDVFSMGLLGGNGTVQFGAMAGNALFSGMIMDSQSGAGEVGFLFGSPAVNLASFKSTGAAMQMPLSVTNAGVFSNSQMNLYTQSLVNGCNPLSEFSYIFTPPSKTTEAITGCVTVPSGSGVFQGNGVAGYVNNQSGSTTPAVAVFGLARVSVQSSGRIWGGNFVASGATGFPSVSLYGTENDCNVFNAGDVCHGMLINGSFATQPTVTIGVEVTPPVSAACPTCSWPYGVRFDEGATSAPTINNAAVYFFPVASGTSQVSQGLTFLGSNSGGTHNIIATENLDILGNLDIVTSAANTGILLNGLQVRRTIASGTATMTTSAIGAGACGSTVTVAATGALTTDVIDVASNSSVAANPGVLIINKWPTANNVNFNYCNPTAGSITPSASTLNFAVAR